ncbi:hybrid sensor histidine kinase/response regulator [Oleiphilus messinensis]|uniref:hybrid sensor histidine kinase/response regulator n=1 Tax=Oleiphilus messinensis TaxID=141451 RepID=UPI000B3B86F4|nr:hybrid sensor histidine kinase/response regulator [Oleiphilus messinensis]
MIKKTSHFFSASLAASTLLQFAIRITIVVLVVTGISYWHIFSSLKEQTYDGLKNYISERGQKESAIFSLAEDNHQTAKIAFSEFWLANQDQPATGFNRIFEPFPDGTTRIPQAVFDGVDRGDGSRSHSISGFVGPGAPVQENEFRQRLLMSYWLISRFGEAWGNRFPNFYITMPENVVIGYWPGLPWGLHAEADFNITTEEWFYVADKTHNPERESVWTGLYYDHTVDEWMVSCITPVDQDNRYLLNLGHDILLNSLFERTFNDRLEGTYNFIFRNDGRLIAHPEQTEALRKASGQLFIRDVDDPELNDMHTQIKAALVDNPDQVFLLNDQTNGNILAIAPINGPDWYFVTVYPKTLLTSVALKTAHFILWLGLISLAVEMIMLYLVFRKKVISPLTVFSRASDAITSGNYHLTEVEGMNGALNQHNEVGFLARTLERMATELLSYHEELERKVAERTEELHLATEEAKKADRAKSDFLARMSHEIRTPMNAILGMTRLALKSELSTKQRGYIEKIQISSDMLMGIINDILDFSKIAAGKLSLEKIPFNLHEVLDNISHVISLKVDTKGLEFIYHMDPNVPEELEGDPLRLGQVLINLANNAVKFTESGEVIISVSMLNRTEDSVELCFSVKDTGIGISKRDLQNLFSPFTQADGSVTRKYGGTGLGLAICSQLVEMMDGRIHVESLPGQGSEFIFTSQFGLAHPEESIRQFPLEMGNIKVLVVDDNETARTILINQIESFGLRVEEAASGREAINKLEAAAHRGHPFRLILMDWKMPEMNGIETTRRIKNIQGLGALPKILMVTAFGREEVMHLAEGAGLDGFLIKPVNASILFNTINSVLTTGEIKNNLKDGMPSGPSSKHGLDDIKGARILLVEDNALNREVALSFLEDSGVIVDIAENGVVAIEMIKTQPYELVLMDVQMPEMDGLTATRIIRSDSRFAQLPIIAMTAHAMSGDREKSLDAGMNDHLVKPVDPDQLNRLMAKWIETEQIKPNTGEKPALTNEARPNLPKRLPGIDIEGAIASTRNNHRLLLNLLQNFYTNYHRLPDNLAGFLEQNEKPEEECTLTPTKIADLAHTIKPLAIYFCAYRLAETAKEIEHVIRSNVADFSVQLIEFIAALREVTEGLANLPDPKPSPDTSSLPDKNKGLSILKQMKLLLQADDASAENLLRELYICLPEPEYLPYLEKLEFYIEDVEYGSALTIIKAITEALAEKVT